MNQGEELEVLVNKEVKTPPCSCCGHMQKTHESWKKITPERVFYNEDIIPLVNINSNPSAFFLCPSCYTKVFEKLTPYSEEIKKTWVACK